MFSALPAFAEDYFAKKYELQFAPYAGYSNYSGFHIGADVHLLVPISESWQWKVGGGEETSKYGTEFALNTGAVYNFSEDWSRSFYLGAGIAYGNFYRLTAYSDHDNRKVYGYMEFGKRFVLNKSGTFTWDPHLTVNSNTTSGGNVIINPLSFGWSF